jgi:hypothetical protein
MNEQECCNQNCNQGRDCPLRKKELTDEEIKDFIGTFPIIFTPNDLVTFARAILKKASEK